MHPGGSMPLAASVAIRTPVSLQRGTAPLVVLPWRTWQRLLQALGAADGHVNRHGANGNGADVQQHG